VIATIDPDVANAVYGFLFAVILCGLVVIVWPRRR
jgi:hypothetical protein